MSTSQNNILNDYGQFIRIQDRPLPPPAKAWWDEEKVCARCKTKDCKLYLAQCEAKQCKFKVWHTICPSGYWSKEYFCESCFRKVELEHTSCTECTSKHCLTNCPKQKARKEQEKRKKEDAKQKAIVTMQVEKVEYATGNRYGDDSQAKIIELKGDVEFCKWRIGDEFDPQFMHDTDQKTWCDLSDGDQIAVMYLPARNAIDSIVSKLS